MPPAASSSSVSWPLVARDAELACIADARARGDCPGVVVGAPEPVVLGVDDGQLLDPVSAVRARELHVPGQGTAAPAIDGLGSDAIGLTVRETQIVELVRRGLSNSEVADQLVLSVRTVETYVYRAMQKRGVGNRRDL